MTGSPDKVLGMMLTAYLIGSIPFGVIVGRLKGVDPRNVGSGNIGMTNVWRALGPTLGLTVFLLDVLKGFAPVWIVKMALQEDGSFRQSAWATVVAVLVAVSAFAGHNWPVFLKFKGGKGVSTGLGVLLALDWRVALADWGAFFVLLGLTRYVSAGSTAAALTLPFWFWYFTRGYAGSNVMVAFGVLAGILIIYKHRANYVRIVQGTEPKIGRKRGGS